MTKPALTKRKPALRDGLAVRPDWQPQKVAIPSAAQGEISLPAITIFITARREARKVIRS